MITAASSAAGTPGYNKQKYSKIIHEFLRRRAGLWTSMSGFLVPGSRFLRENG